MDSKNNNETPGELTYAAHRNHVVGRTVEFDELEPSERRNWEAIALAARIPLAEKLFKARVAVGRLLVTYRDQLHGNWYQETAKDCGIKLNDIGFIEADYRNTLGTETWDQRKIEQIAKGECE